MFNRDSQTPLNVELPTSTSFSNIEIGAVETAYLGNPDVPNAFYGMRIPESLSRKFAPPGIRAGYLSAGICKLQFPWGAPFSRAHGLGVVVALLSVPGESIRGPWD